MVKKFLENIPGKWQDFPFDSFSMVFLNKSDEEAAELYKKYKKVNCIASVKDNNYELQIVVPSDSPDYLLFLFKTGEEYTFHYSSHPTCQKFPLLKHRICDSIDYEDFVAIQQYLNKMLILRGLTPIQYDLDPAGKSFYSTHEGENELTEDGRYTIIQVRAEDCPETVEEVKNRYRI